MLFYLQNERNMVSTAMSNTLKNPLAMQNTPRAITCKKSKIKLWSHCNWVKQQCIAQYHNQKVLYHRERIQIDGHSSMGKTSSIELALLCLSMSKVSSSQNYDLAGKVFQICVIILHTEKLFNFIKQYSFCRDILYFTFHSRKSKMALMP